MAMMILGVLSIVYAGGIAITSVISRWYASATCGRCAKPCQGRGGCPSDTRWSTTILVSVAWPAIPAFAVWLLVRRIRLALTKRR